MALFKSLRGKRENLPSTKTDGYAYFCTDDATFWIDYKDENGTVQRKQLNAKEAELLAGASLSTVLNSSDVEIPTSKAVKNSPAFTGTPTAPTADAGTNTTQIATTAFVGNAISDLAAKSYVDETVTTHNTATDSHSDIREKIQSIDESIMLKKQTLTPQFPTARDWDVVAYGNGVFVAAASLDKAVYSKDGISWTEVDLPANGYWDSITYGKDKFVMVDNGNSNFCLYSNDGIAWTKSTLPQSTYWIDVAYGNNCFVAIANSSRSYGTSNVAAYSSDGITWTATTLPSTIAWSSVTYGNGKFVALARSSKAAYSTDGITWTEVTLPAYGYWDNLVYGGNKFVAVHSTNSDSVIYSTDGITWSQSTLPAAKANSSISYGNGTYVVTTFNWKDVYYSTDAITWNKVQLNMSGYKSCYGGNKFIITPSSISKKISYSYDGITWYDSYSIDKVQLSDLSTEVQEKFTPEAYTEDEITTLYNAV